MLLNCGVRLVYLIFNWVFSAVDMVTYVVGLAYLAVFTGTFELAVALVCKVTFVALEGKLVYRDDACLRVSVELGQRWLDIRFEVRKLSHILNRLI
jgi:hypothetical protein